MALLVWLPLVALANLRVGADDTIAVGISADGSQVQKPKAKPQQLGSKGKHGGATIITTGPSDLWEGRLGYPVIQVNSLSGRSSHRSTTHTPTNGTTNIITAGPESSAWSDSLGYPTIQCSANGKNCTKADDRERDGSAFLHYIVQNYDDLPEKIVFLHGHEAAWHQLPNFAQTLKDILAHDSRKFVHLGVQRVATNSWDHTGWCVDFWKPFFGDCPERINTYHGMQFIATRQLVHSTSHAKWKQLLDKVVAAGMVPNELMGLGYMMEWCVHILLGQDPRLFGDEECRRNAPGFNLDEPRNFFAETTCGNRQGYTNA